MRFAYQLIQRINLLTVLLLCTISVQAQNIRGKVVDAETGKPIAGANIYLNGTYKGTSSDAEGAFSMATTETNIPLIISHIGYESQTRSDYAGKQIIINLKRKTNQLREVTIGFDAMSREQEMRIFLKEFIGQSINECTITNPDDIYFKYRKKTETLTADADQPLIIRNKKLGYKVTYFLSSFRYTPAEVSYQGNYFFAEDTADLKPKDIKKLLHARDEVYAGSRMHFIRSLWANKLNENNFKLYKDTSIFYKDVVVEHQGQKFIKIPKAINMAYWGQNSYLKQTPENTTTLITRNGFYESNVIWSGAMTIQRVGELLPYEFEPTNRPADAGNIPDKVGAIPAAQNNTVSAQVPGSTPAQGDLQQIISSVTNHTVTQAIEKIYVHTDKPFYALGDTLWYKAYLFNAAYLTSSTKSGLAYIEIANDQNVVIKRQMIALTAGLGWGNLVLNEKEFPQGNYILRAYTNWMRNYDDNYIFKKQFYISTPGKNDLLIKSNFSTKVNNDKKTAYLNLQLTNLSQQPVLLTSFQLNVTEGNKTWYKDKVQTQMDNLLAFNFDVPNKANLNKLAVTLQAINKKEPTPIYTIPVILNRPENTDLQFMPEGGYLAEGVKSHIAFKALAEDGNGTDISGLVYDSKNQEVAAFKSLHRGIGSFDLMPQPGESYTARIKLSDGNYSKSYPLPLVKPSGIVLNVVNNFKSDSLQVNLTLTADMQNAVTAYYLIAQSRGIACYGAVVRIKGSRGKVTIDKSIFPTGITRFSILNSAGEALNERIVYVNHEDFLRVHVSPNKDNYSKRDSVGLNIWVTDKANNPISGSFSIAVNDDGQVKNESLKNNSLLSNLLLTNDLKGNIEDPGYYFQPVLTASVWKDLDNLLLAQGWVNYDWAATSQPLKPKLFEAESEFSIKGKVSGIFGKPTISSGVILLSKKPSFVIDTMTDKAGIFNFKNIVPSDTSIYFIQARNKKGQSFNVGIDINEFKPTSFALPSGRVIPWYVNVDSVKIKAANTSLTYNTERDRLMNGHLLKEVKIEDQKIIPDSKNLNGDGLSDFAMNQDDLNKAGKMPLGEMLEKNIKGFRVGFGKSPNSYFVGDQLFHLIIDGQDVDFAYFGRSEYDHLLFIRQYLDFFTAEDIKGIELLKSPKYVGRYWMQFLNPLEIPEVHAWVEVTTRSGHGPFVTHTPGTYIYKPIAFSSQKQFYSPKYTAKFDNSVIDSRSTIYWEPNVITDQNGKATVSFYTSDNPGKYTMVLEGSDMNGNIGSLTQKLVVSKSLP